jgi:hypothetical protein
MTPAVQVDQLQLPVASLTGLHGEVAVKAVDEAGDRVRQRGVLGDPRRGVAVGVVVVDLGDRLLPRGLPVGTGRPLT